MHAAAPPGLIKSSSHWQREVKIGVNNNCKSAAMKLLRSTFVGFCLARTAAAFTVQPAHRGVARLSSPASASALQMVGIHDQTPAGGPSDEDIKLESAFRQVLREVDLAKDYLDWLVEESGGAAASAEEGGPTFAEVIAEKAEASASGGEVGLFGGGGDIPESSPAVEETVYQPSLRSNLGSIVLLTGTVDPTLLNVLNNNFFGQDLVDNFDFTTIKALVKDAASARKRAISREARYGGLLDKLVVEELNGSLPAAADLEGAGSWIIQVAHAEAGTLLPQIADLAKAAGELKHVIVMIEGSPTTDAAIEGWDAVVAASVGGEAFQPTLLSVGALDDEYSETFSHVGKLGEDNIPSGAMPSISKKRAYQLVAHALAIESTAGEALAAYDYPAPTVEMAMMPEAKGEFAKRDDDGKELEDKMADVKLEGRMVRAMRETGFTQVMELDVLIEKGLEGFKAYIADPPNKENAFTKAKSARDEEDEKIMAILEEETAKSDARKKAEAEEARKIEVEGIAKEWAIKEYSLRMLGGDLDQSMSEKDFMVATWDEALAEANKTYDRIHSEEYLRQVEKADKARVGVENKLFWDGMPPALRKKREVMVEKVKKQYMDLLSEAELEQIILSE
ncbi:hypothetical protein ACHAXT_007623 [Thalassiosira profunda]